MKLFLIMILVLSSVSFSADLIDIELSKYDPFPAESGKFLTVWVKVSNIGTNVIDELNVDVETEYPLKFLNEEGTRVFRNININDYVLLEYRLSVDVAGPDGDTKFNVITYSNENLKTITELNITVENPNDESELKALFDGVDPLASPGSVVNLSVDIVNRNHGIAYFTLVEASTDIGKIEKNTVAIGNQDPDDFDSADFEIDINDDVTPGKYPVNIKFSYKDSDGVKKESFDTVYITVLTQDEANTTNNTSITDYIIIIIVLFLIYKFIILPRKDKIIELKKKLL